MRKALFLDRDGVLNRERGEYTFNVNDFDLLPDVVKALKIASDKGYMLIVISNQGGVAKGVFSKADVEAVHQYLNQKLAESGVKLDEIYYCPHHNEVGKCICRKPDSLMLEKAIARFKIDANCSVMIGDSQRDIDAAHKASVKGILVEPNSGILNVVNELE